AGAVMIWFGLSVLLRRSGIKIPKMPLPGFLQRLATRGHRSAMRLPALMRAGAIGLLTTLLPCGWLYAFVVVAAGTARPLTGGLVMLAFWVGTLPILIALGTGLQQGLGALGRKLPVITSMIVVIAGIYALTGRTMLDVQAMANALEPEKIPSTLPSAQSKLPCCDEEN
ncbi:MAG TPA: sulfite exporter TauE/SafE family protein, partial [Tepidisphaeraceae bacterium]|nr:sulfite exporter TauE/SafE family protein [Tepidisphaeraceae bacterium]